MSDRTPIARALVRVLLFAATAGASGCVLTDSADSFPFNPVLKFNDRDEGNANSVVEDLPELDPPSLIFTELLIDAPGSDPSLSERGEYIEIKNVGLGPADPRRITMFLRDPDNPLAAARIKVEDAFSDEERAVVDGLETIEPGEYFVFIRYEDPTVAAISEQLLPGFTYDFGRYANGPTLPHNQAIRRQLDLGYRFANGETAIFDEVRWDGHEFVDPEGGPERILFPEGGAIGVDFGSEGPEANDSPANWCIPPNLVGEVQGTPGGPTSCG